MPPLQPAAVLRDVTNEELPYNGPPAKVDRRDDLMKPLVEEIEIAYGINLQNSLEYSPSCGRGTRFTSTKLTRTRKHASSRCSSLENIRTAPDRGQLAIEAPCHDPLSVGIFPAAGEFRSSQEAKATEEQCKAEYK